MSFDPSKNGHKKPRKELTSESFVELASNSEEWDTLQNYLCSTIDEIVEDRYGGRLGFVLVMSDGDDFATIASNFNSDDKIYASLNLAAGLVGPSEGESVQCDSPTKATRSFLSWCLPNFVKRWFRT